MQAFAANPPARRPNRRLLAAAIISVGVGFLTGCALAGNPQPPTLWLPTPVKDLTAARLGKEVRLHWTMPKNTTDKVTLKGEQRAHFCWSGSGQTVEKPSTAVCTVIADSQFPPAEPANFSVPLPAELAAGPPRAAAFYVELQNPAGKTAGPSNPAWVAAGTAPPAVTGFRAEAGPKGMVLHWDKAAAQPDLVLRIHRTWVRPPNAPRPSQSQGIPPPAEQTLEVDLGQEDAGRALDRDASFDQTWRYAAERVLRVEVDRHTLEMAGPSSSTVTLDAKDVFPPAVPQGLAAVPDAQAHAIDLSWVPDADADVAGYVVYRRDRTSGETPQRISPAKPQTAPSFTDTGVVPGHSYAYSVSAVDRDGNASAPSIEVEAEIPE